MLPLPVPQFASPLNLSKATICSIGRFSERGLSGLMQQDRVASHRGYKKSAELIRSYSGLKVECVCVFAVTAPKAPRRRRPSRAEAAVSPRCVSSIYTSSNKTIMRRESEAALGRVYTILDNAPSLLYILNHRLV